MGEQRLRSVNTYWERKVQSLEESKRAELDCFNQLNAETEDFLRAVAMCERMRSITLEQVEAALQNPSLAYRSKVHRSEYSSVPPAVYSLNNTNAEDRPSISALNADTSRRQDAAHDQHLPHHHSADVVTYSEAARDNN